VARIAVISFPGSNCDRDIITAIRDITGTAPNQFWHKESTMPRQDLVILPGGFSFGDYLRCGAIAARSPIMDEVLAFKS
jgi:phosphoribosylformylglycinamidine (FGAM) synthase-like amidotransferase family enzyme